MELGLAYVSAHLPYHIEDDIRQMKEIGCSEVLFALQENHFDTLCGAVRSGARIARDHGIRPLVVVWGYANTFGGGLMSNMLLNDQEMWRVQKDGKLMPKACLNNPKLAQHFIGTIDLCHQNGFEGLLIDEPAPQECFCPHCRKIFSDNYAKDLITSVDSDEYRRFQLDTVKEYVERVCKGVKAIDEKMRTVTAMMPHDHEAFERVASIAEMDEFGTDPYWLVPGAADFMHIHTIEEAVDCARDFKALCIQSGKRSQMWLNCWKIPSGREEEIYSGGKQLGEIGFDTFYSWGFRAALGTNEECDRPEEAWKSLTKLYRELSGKA